MCAFEIGPRNRTAKPFKVIRDLASDVAAIEVIETGMPEVVEHGGERRLLQYPARIRRLALDEKCLCEAGHMFELEKLFRCKARLAAAHGVAFARVTYCLGEKIGERDSPAISVPCFERETPTRDCTGSRKRCERPARRNGFMLAVELTPRIGCGAPYP